MLEPPILIFKVQNKDICANINKKEEWGIIKEFSCKCIKYL